MKAQRGENLKELFAHFLEPFKAEQAANDITKGDEILNEYEDPIPNEELISLIKTKIAWSIQRRKRKVLKQRFLQATAAAAAVIILTIATLNQFIVNNRSSEDVIGASASPGAVWESDENQTEDTDVSNITAEIEEVEKELSTEESKDELW